MEKQSTLYMIHKDHVIILSLIQITLYIKIVLMLIINLVLHNAFNMSISKQLLSII